MIHYNVIIAFVCGLIAGAVLVRYGIALHSRIITRHDNGVAFSDSQGTPAEADFTGDELGGSEQ